MDVAAFVGVAARGPVDTPVPLEDFERFGDVFGAEAPLAWDPRAGRRVTGHLAPAVEAFFRNGGRRCWVVRVARGARTNELPLPGLIDARTGLPAVARARSAGSWSDDLRVGAVLTRQVLGQGQLSATESGPYRVDLRPEAGPVGPGDLLRVTLQDAILFLTVRAASPAALHGPDADGGGRSAARPTAPATLRLAGDPVRWFARIDTLPPGLDATARLVPLRTGRPSSAASIAASLAPGPGFAIRVESAAPDQWRLRIDRRAAPEPLPEAGDLLWIDLPDSAAAPGGGLLWLVVQSAAEHVSGGSPPAGEVCILAAEALAPLDGPPEDFKHPAQGDKWPCRVERLTFELVVWRGQEVQARLKDLAFTEPVSIGGGVAPRSEEGRFWARLPSDDDLFRRVGEQPEPPPAGTFEAEVFDPRFPLAGPESPAAAYLPLGMASLPAPSLAQGRRQAGPQTALERDGLAAFDYGLFLDAPLAGLTIPSLQRRIRRELSAGSGAAGLRGIHSLLPITEVSLLAVPDAAHRGWRKGSPPMPSVLPAPEQFEVRQVGDAGSWRARWSGVSQAAETESGAGRPADVRYELLESANPDFSAAAARYRGAETEARFAVEVGGRRILYYRVRARTAARIGPWSITRAIVTGPGGFWECGLAPLAAPQLRLDSAAEPPSEGPMLRWTAVTAASSYTVQEAQDAAFLTAVDLPGPAGGRASQPALALRPDLHRGGVVFYRVRALRGGELGPWSNTVTCTGHQETWMVRGPRDYDETALSGQLLAVQRAAIRFCAARGDMVAILSMPQHFDEDRAAAHAAALRGEDEARPAQGPATDAAAGAVPALRFDERRAPSFAALYHPWLASVSTGGGAGGAALRPPDGAVCGHVAARTLRDGAWAAPANQEIRGVVSLSPMIDADSWRRLAARSVNLLRPDPRGVRALSAETLSLTSELRPLGVRRLLILLRRLALREGDVHAFADNTIDTRRRIYYHFSNLLGSLYQRGAFAGDTPAGAYRVITDESVNPQEGLDRGRLVVELLVAPSQPLMFLTVRLVQHQAAAPVLEEV